MSVAAVLIHRKLPLTAVAVVLACQSLVAVLSGEAGPFALWPNTLLLLVPSIVWLPASTPNPSLAATGVMAVFLVVANMFGGAGYIAAFYLGLPLAAVAAWLVARRGRLY